MKVRGLSRIARVVSRMRPLCKDLGLAYGVDIEGKYSPSAAIHQASFLVFQRDPATATHFASSNWRPDANSCSFGTIDFNLSQDSCIQALNKHFSGLLNLNIAALGTNVGSHMTIGRPA